MNAPSETPYIETEALLAVMNDDAAKASGLVADMLPAERVGFYHQISVLADIVGHQIAEESGASSASGRHRRQ